MRTSLKTEDDLLDMSDDEMTHELVAGVIVAEPFPSWHHDEVRQALEMKLFHFVREHDLGSVRAHTGYVLRHAPDTVRSPDVSFVRKDRLQGFDRLKFFRGAPDLAIEILSPTNRPAQVRAKLVDYIDAGCRLVWVIDPKRKVATTYRSLDRPSRIPPDGTLDGEDVLPGFSIPLASIFVPAD